MLLHGGDQTILLCLFDIEEDLSKCKRALSFRHMDELLQEGRQLLHLRIAHLRQVHGDFFRDTVLQFSILTNVVEERIGGS